MQPMVARYARSGGEWVVVLSGHGKALSATASGIVEARGLADQLVAKIVSESQKDLIVLRLLNDSALEFTRAYLAAHLASAATNLPTAPTRQQPPQARLRQSCRTMNTVPGARTRPVTTRQHSRPP